VEGAVEAAVAVARGLRVNVREPRVLRDVTNVLVHLAPALIVARVPVTFDRLRGRSWLEAELELVSALHDQELPVAGPTREFAAGPYERDGFLVTLWEYVENDRESPLHAAAAGAALRRIHDGLAELPGTGLEHYARLDELAALLAGLRLERDDQDVLRRGLEAAAAAVASIDAPLQIVHGDAHLANVLRTRAGPIWSDFENACLGPRELDLAGLTIRAIHGAAESQHSTEALAAYGDHDASFVQRLIPVHALFLAMWTSALAERVPTVRPLAQERIGWVREGFAL
jgi:Ser/Thr protein kinase RdoA (MazF antagonist)